jgi:SSS family solute:Na+ symporter
MGIISFIGFTLLVAVVAYLATRNTDENTSDGYFLGGRSLTATVIAGSLLLTNLSTEQIVGLNGDAYKDGILVMAWETLAAIAIVITAVFLLPRYLKGGISTIPTFLERRFDSTTKAMTSGLFLTGYAVVLLPMVLFTGSKAISGMFDIPQLLGVSEWGAIWICVWGIGIVGSIYAIFGGLKAVAVSDTINAVGLLIGGLLIPVFGLIAISEDGSLLGGLTKLATEHPEKMNAIQRALGAKNLAEGQKGLTIAAFIKILGPIIVVLPGIIAFHKYGEGMHTSDVYPTLVADVLPEVWIGFFAAVLFGAILSSFNSALNSCVTLYGVDIYKQFIDKEATDEVVVKKGKRFGVILAFFAMIIAPFLVYADSIFGYLQTVNGAYSVPILTVLVIGFVTKRVPALAAKAGVIFAFTIYVLYIILSDGLGIVTLHMLHMQAITCVLTIILMLVIGKLKPRATDYEQTYTEQVDVTPWKFVKPVGLVICLIVISTYFIFN